MHGEHGAGGHYSLHYAYEYHYETTKSYPLPVVYKEHDQVAGSAMNNEF
jgi:hypothetical protein